MEFNKMEQMEALGILADFNDRLLKNLPTIISELSGKRQPDTDTYLKNIVDSINWVITVTGNSLDILNEGYTRINKDTFNQKVMALSQALSDKKDSAIAAALQELIPCFEQLGKRSYFVIYFRTSGHKRF